MNRTRSRLIAPLLWFGLLLFSLRPPAALQEGLAVLVAPLRFTAALASPLTWLRRPEVQAAESRLALLAEEEADQKRRLLADLARFARPSEPELLAGRRLVSAEVRGRVRGNKDRLEILATAGSGIVPGLPVACGDAYVGRVARVGEARHDGRVLAEVDLVTGRGFHVGAQLDEGPGGVPVLMTVGGVDSGSSRTRRADRQVRLAVHNPSDRELERGFVRVHELFEKAEPYSELSVGLHLGEVRREEGGKRWTIEPELDYVDGLFHVVVLCPPESSPQAESSPELLLDANWVRAVPIGPGDPSPWRESVKIDAGRSQDVRAGAAVIAIGARLVGRVSRVSSWSADVSFLGDPGFSVVAIARLEGDERPRVLGRLVSLGRDEADRSVLFRWVPRVSLDLAARGEERARPARLFTGSGEGGAQSGFYLGRALLPASPRAGEPHVIRLLCDVDPRDVRTLFVRVDERGEGAP